MKNGKLMLDGETNNPFEISGMRKPNLFVNNQEVDLYNNVEEIDSESIRIKIPVEIDLKINQIRIKEILTSKNSFCISVTNNKAFETEIDKSGYIKHTKYNFVKSKIKL
jgi:hypothetical protein